MKNDGLSEEEAVKKTIELLDYALVVQKKTERNKTKPNKTPTTQHCTQTLFRALTLSRNIHPNLDIELRRVTALALLFTRIITVALILPHRPRSSTSHFGLSFLHPNPSPKSKSLVLIARSIFFSQTSDSYSHSPPCSTSGYSM